MLEEETVEQSYEIDTIHWPVRHRPNGGAKAVYLVAIGFCLGLCISLTGPCFVALPDKLDINIGEISRVFVSHAAGSLIGSFVAVFTSDSPALVLLSLLIMAVGVAVVPWSKTLLLLAASFTLQGLALGVLQTKHDESSSSSAAVSCAFHAAFGLGATAVPVAIGLLLHSQQSTVSFANPSSSLGITMMDPHSEFESRNSSTSLHRGRRSVNTTDDLNSQEISVGSVNQSTTTLELYQTVPTTSIPRIKPKKPKPIADGSRLNSDPKYADGRNIRDPIRENLGKIPPPVEDSFGKIGAMTSSTPMTSNMSNMSVEVNASIVTNTSEKSIDVNTSIVTNTSELSVDVNTSIVTNTSELSVDVNASIVTQSFVTLTTLKAEELRAAEKCTSSSQSMVNSSTSNPEDLNVEENVTKAMQSLESNITEHDNENVTQANVRNNSENISENASTTRHQLVNQILSLMTASSIVGNRNFTFPGNSSLIFLDSAVDHDMQSDAKPSSTPSRSGTLSNSSVTFRSIAPSQYDDFDATHRNRSAVAEVHISTTTVQSYSSLANEAKVASLFSSILSRRAPTTTSRSIAHRSNFKPPSVMPLSSGSRTTEKPTSVSMLSEISNSPKILDHNGVSDDSIFADSLGPTLRHNGGQTTLEDMESSTANASWASQNQRVINSKRPPSKHPSINAVYATISSAIAFTGILIVVIRILSAKRTDSRGYHAALEQRIDQRSVTRLIDNGGGSSTAALFAVVAILHFFCSGAEWTFTGLMPCFALFHIGWSQSISASLTASFWISFAVGRVLCSSGLLSRRVTYRSSMLGGLMLGFVAMGVLTVSLPQSTGGVLFSWWHRFGIGTTALVWISSALFGFGSSLVSSAAERYVLACGGRCLKFAAVLGSCAGEMIVPAMSGMLSMWYGLDWVINTAFAAVAGCLAVGLVFWYIAPANVGAKDNPSLLVQMLGDSIEAVSRTPISLEDPEDVSTDVNEDEEAELLSKCSSMLDGDSQSYSLGSHLSSRARMGTSRTPKTDY